MKKRTNSLYLLITILLTIFIYTIFTYNYQEKKDLQLVINYDIKEKNSYTPKSYEEYESALNYAINLKNDIFASKSELDYASNNLKNTIDNLILKPDKNELINIYESVINYNQDLYIPKSTTNLNSSIKHAEAIITDENSTKEDVTKAINLINTSIEKLILKPDKTILKNLINNITNINEEEYTTDSYNILKNNLSIANQILNNENSIQEDIDNITNTLNNNINNLVIASRGIYKINIYAYMLSNNHVGNEWYYYTTYNNNEFNNETQIIDKSNTKINLITTIVEDDKIPDYGTNYITITLKNNFEATERISVRENRGRYTGNIAIWEIKYSVKLIENIT